MLPFHILDVSSDEILKYLLECIFAGRRRRVHGYVWHDGRNDGKRGK